MHAGPLALLPALVISSVVCKPDRIICALQRITRKALTPRCAKPDLPSSPPLVRFAISMQRPRTAQTLTTSTEKGSAPEGASSVPLLILSAVAMTHGKPRPRDTLTEFESDILQMTSASPACVVAWKDANVSSSCSSPRRHHFLPCWTAQQPDRCVQCGQAQHVETDPGGGMSGKQVAREHESVRAVTEVRAAC
jgi:hypothetical protein